MKKILISLLVIVTSLVLFGCEKDENINNNLNNEINSNHAEEPTNNNSNSFENTMLDDEIIEIDDEENKPIREEIVNVSEVINCDECVFAYFDGEDENAKTLGSTLLPNEYTTDVRTIKTKGGKQRHNFFGLVLSGNTISKAYACILKDNKVYCIQGSTNGAYHDNNISILNKIFTSGQCRTISDGNTYTCTDGSYNGDTKTNGYTSLHYETSCTIYGSAAKTGQLICH